MARILAVAALAVIAIASCLSIASADVAIAHCWVHTGALKATFFFTHNTTDNALGVKLHFIEGYTVGNNYSVFISTYGDNSGVGTHGECFSGQTKAIGRITPEATGGVMIEGPLDEGVISLIGASSVLGRTIAIYENLMDDNCTTAAASTPVGRGVIGAAWPGTGVANVNPASAPLTTNPTSAYAEIIGTTGTYGDHSGISGGVWFQANSDNTMTVLVNITGASITDGQHALHVHEYGDLSMSNATSMNGHWNPWKRTHGAPLGDRHAGDMGNVTALNGWIYSVHTFDLLTFQGAGSIIGRGVVLHTLRDDGNPENSTTSVGAAGGRIARGVIGVSSRTVPLSNSSSSSSSSSSTGSWSSSSTGVSGAVSTSSLSTVAIVIAAVVAFVANKQQ